MELDRALADSFPASDPPSITQPGCLKPGGPERKHPSRRYPSALSHSNRGYSLFSFTRASAVVNCQSALV